MKVPVFYGQIPIDGNKTLHNSDGIKNKFRHIGEITMLKQEKLGTISENDEISKNSTKTRNKF